jgi:hypothetical protein
MSENTITTDVATIVEDVNTDALEAEQVTEAGTEAAATEEQVSEQAPEVEAPKRNVQRMTLSIPVDVDMGEWESRFGVKGWSPTRESLVAYLHALLVNSPAVTDGQIEVVKVK